MASASPAPTAHYSNCSDEITMHDGWGGMPKAGKAFLVSGGLCAGFAVFMGCTLHAQMLDALVCRV